MATLLLARSGETTWYREGRVQGWAPVSLSDDGRRQADALARHVERAYGVDRIVTSDIERARETAQFVADAVGVEPAFDPAWRDRDAGSLQGLDARGVFAKYPQYALRDVGVPATRERPPSGESLVEARRRVVTAFDGLVGSLDDDETVVVVTHGTPIRLVLGVVKELDTVDAILAQELDHGCLCELDVAVATDDVGDEPTVTVVAENLSQFDAA
ncbi:histidine phosphatase family protein [Haloferax larsenii]|uniref:Probable phosphoglycerate mutase n=1 Tax=Haloferax larsenii TaxID=302484 RepID=A0A1H7L5Z5_HALLR|nr:histidine phosphatase family protein [Haloferax larsenii]SEK94254.1 probable phosphoglycerate mutase [Haloferax larsenii]